MCIPCRKKTIIFRIIFTQHNTNTSTRKRDTERRLMQVTDEKRIIKLLRTRKIQNVVVY